MRTVEYAGNEYTFAGKTLKSRVAKGTGEWSHVPWPSYALMQALIPLLQGEDEPASVMREYEHMGETFRFNRETNTLESDHGIKPRPYEEKSFYKLPYERITADLLQILQPLITDPTETRATHAPLVVGKCEFRFHPLLGYLEVRVQGSGAAWAQPANLSAYLLRALRPLIGD